MPEYTVSEFSAADALSPQEQLAITVADNFLVAITNAVQKGADAGVVYSGLLMAMVGHAERCGHRGAVEELLRRWVKLLRSGKPIITETVGGRA